MLHVAASLLHRSDALSTAYQYPLIDGKILEGDKGQPIIEVPLDGTQYELETGKVSVRHVLWHQPLDSKMLVLVCANTTSAW